MAVTKKNQCQLIKKTLKMSKKNDVSDAQNVQIEQCD